MPHSYSQQWSRLNGIFSHFGKVLVLDEDVTISFRHDLIIIIKASPRIAAAYLHPRERAVEKCKTSRGGGKAISI